MNFLSLNEIYFSPESGHIIEKYFSQDNLKLERLHRIMHSTKKWSFPLRVFSVNLTKSAVSCRWKVHSHLKSWAKFFNNSVSSISLNSYLDNAFSSALLNELLRKSFYRRCSTILAFCLGKYSCETVNASLWKSEGSVSNRLLF